jgi:SAM-dependent methyltransferase
MTDDEFSDDVSHYLHGAEPSEQDRLARLNDLLNERCLAELRLTAGDRVLDVGCGLGQLTREMARQAGEVVGFERSMEQLREALRLADAASESGAVDFRQGDAVRFPLQDEEWGTFDVAHARFVVEHVRDPLVVVRHMVKAVKPGGRIVLADDGHDTLRLWPEPAGFDRLWSAYMRTYERVGNDSMIGHRLIALLAEAGADPVRNNWVFFGACAGQEELFAAYVDNIARILEGVKSEIVALGEFDAASFDERLSHLREWGTRSDAAIWYAVSWAEGRRPNSSSITGTTAARTR